MWQLLELDPERFFGPDALGSAGLLRFDDLAPELNQLQALGNDEGAEGSPVWPTSHTEQKLSRAE